MDVFLAPGTYDLFLVGGGGAMTAKNYSYDVQTAHGGGGGGYTKTILSQQFESHDSLEVIIGAGGASPGANGSSTSFTNATGLVAFNVDGGKSAKAPTGSDIYLNGGDGGSGGGGATTSNSFAGGAGGSDGSNGSTIIASSGGVGQGTTTRLFENLSGVLYAGGGGGGHMQKGKGGPGGAGGGGSGSTSSGSSGGNGTPNTGGGGGGAYSAAQYEANARCGKGGSGIIVVRWNN